MMKRAFLILLCVLLFCLTSCSERGDKTLKANNDTPITSIEKSYAEEDVREIQEKMHGKTLTYNDIKSAFKYQCIRKTFQGYYLILRLHTEKLAFIFLNNDLELTCILIQDKFLRKSDFDIVSIKDTKESEVNKLDQNAIYYPVSYVNASGHILSDGFILILYERIMDGVLLDDPVVKTIEYVSNEDIEKRTDDFWISSTPYILPIDKNQ